MLHNKFQYTSLNLVILSLAIFGATKVAATDLASSQIYLLPNDVKCKKSYCTDKNDQPVTGEIRKYDNNVLIRRYIMQKGYLQGTSYAYDKYGHLQMTRDYSSGLLDGYVTEYNINGTIKSKIAYRQGKKEGTAIYNTDKTVTKLSYTQDQLNGKMRIWDKQKQDLIYDIDLANDKIISGTYYHYAQDDVRCCKRDSINCLNQEHQTQAKALSNKDIHSLNLKERYLREELSCNTNPLQ